MNYKKYLIIIGEIFLLYLSSIKIAFTKKIRLNIIKEQIILLGINSLPIVSFTALFSGMVMAFQSATELRKFGADIYIGAIVAISFARELGPVFTALMVAGRIGAGITAQIGSMKVTEQIEALEAMAVDPIDYLVTPRLIAVTIMLPVLTIYADFIGFFGAFIIGTIKLGINRTLFLDRTFWVLSQNDILTGLFKSFIFAQIITIIGCYCGFKTEEGAQGVGKATIFSVVSSCMLIFLFDYLLTALFYN
ncbi:MAG TPA: ABC transporter permease [bacterium]|nr:ABC transporter permease [bacterium]